LPSNHFLKKTRTHELSERARAAEDERNALAATLAQQRSERDVEAAAMSRVEAKLRAELATVQGRLNLRPCFM
jgi:multidrug efflux pump subunit AcrA (membrane-fusion protein)